jgi:hypothetical protein
MFGHKSTICPKCQKQCFERKREVIKPIEHDARFIAAKRKPCFGKRCKSKAFPLLYEHISAVQTILPLAKIALIVYLKLFAFEL